MMSCNDKKPEAVGAPAAGAVDGTDQTAGAMSQAAGGEDEGAALRGRLADAEAEAQAHCDALLRARADLENFKKRARREQAESLRFANEQLIRDLLPVVDNLERAVEHAAGGGNGAPLVEGVSLVLKSLHDVLKRCGVEPVDAAAGEPFDPVRHEAVGRQEAEGESNRIVEQHERGYFLHERLLRPAKVVVSCAKSADDGVENGEDDG